MWGSSSDTHDGCCMCTTAIVMILFVLPIVIRFVNFMYAHFLRPSKNLTKFGQWAIVTGATDGIGQALANEMAKKKMNIVLISRNLEKLNTEASAIETNHKVQTRVVAVDFMNFDEKQQKKVWQTISDLDVGVLVNNVGMSYSHPQFFEELPEEDMEALMHMNINSTNRMMKMVLPIMKKNKRGCIVNMGSGSGENSCPLLSVYSASKAYIDFLSAGVNAEYKNIHIQSQTPLFVTSKLSKIRKPNMTTPTPAKFAKSSVRFFGYESVCSPFFMHAVMLYIISILPQNIVESKTLGMHLGLRKRALKKKEKEAAGK